MQQPLWKKWLSYLMDVRLESLSSDYNEELHVLLSRGRYQLCTQNAVYSFDDLYVNFDRAFHELDIRTKAPKDVLVLGLGLGSIPFMLERKYGLDAEYTAVEIDDTIIYLAGKYSLNDIRSPIQYINADAAAFMEMNSQQYDLVCMDIFEDDVVPPQFETEAFLEQLQSALRPEGLLLFNRLALLETDISQTSAFYENQFKTVFPDAHYLDVKGNWILVGK